MEEEEEANDNLCIAKLFDSKLKKKKKKKTKTTKPKKTQTVAVDSAINGGAHSGPRVSLFDYSVDNFFRDMDSIARLCGNEQQHCIDLEDQTEIQRMSSSVTFLRQWRDFKYPSRSVKFAHGLESSECCQGKDVGAISLPQFSSAIVPKEVESQDSRDFVMNVGGSIWALDWCPRIHEDPDCSIKCEFIAVAAHPPGSSYHKIGASLAGRGVVQIWCIVNIRGRNEETSSVTEKRKGRPKKDGGTNDKSSQMKRPRGRPRKNATVTALDDTNCDTQDMPSLNIRGHNEDTSSVTEKRKGRPKKDGGTNDKSSQMKRPRGRPRKNLTIIAVDETNCDTQHMPSLNISGQNEDTSHVSEKRKGRSKKDGGTNDKLSQIKRPRGKPGKSSTVIALDKTNCETQYLPSLAAQFAENSIDFSAPDGNHENSEEIFPTTNKRKRGPKKTDATDDKSAPMKRPRGRSKRNSREVTTSDLNCNDQFVPLAVQFPEDSAGFISPDVAHGNCNEYAAQQCSDTEQKHAKRADFASNSETFVKSRLNIDHMEGRSNEDVSQPLLIQCGNATSHQMPCSSELEPPEATCSIPDVTMPRVVSCLAHNGKVAWDVKWRPLNNSDSICKHRMGYLAVLLGNGSLEVWEVPLPHVLREIYGQREGTDPRFVKLDPVFKCSMLKRGGKQSIPLTIEWSVTPPHEYLLAGCHDGTVALWKFSTNSSSKCDDTKPVLCFGGDTVPIRTVAWAPFEGDPESSNIIATAGHEGLKFWDLRNPFRPLRNLHPAPRIIYSLDWLSKPSCIIMSFDDGTMRTISLMKAANELPVTGITYNGKKQPWLHGSTFSTSAIWSVHVSPITGMAAYCCADGTAIRFQLTTKAVDTDCSHNRTPYFLCGSQSEEESTLIVNTPVSNTRFALRKPQERVHAQSFREFISKEKLGKSVNNQMAKANDADSQILALYDGDNLSLESDDALSSGEHHGREKSSSNRKKKVVESTAIVCIDDVSTSTRAVDDDKSDFGGIPEVFPSKMVALHRVRWNMNMGSERWLCYGGASGVLRCQEIEFSLTDKSNQPGPSAWVAEGSDEKFGGQLLHTKAVMSS